MTSLYSIVRCDVCDLNCPTYTINVKNIAALKCPNCGGGVTFVREVPPPPENYFEESMNG